jgi:hypothetical protein
MRTSITAGNAASVVASTRTGAHTCPSLRVNQGRKLSAAQLKQANHHKLPTKKHYVSRKIEPQNPKKQPQNQKPTGKTRFHPANPEGIHKSPLKTPQFMVFTITREKLSQRLFFGCFFASTIALNCACVIFNLSGCAATHLERASYLAGVQPPSNSPPFLPC